MSSGEPESATYQALLREAYEGEIFGEAFLARILHDGGHPAHQAQLQSLHRLEERTRDAMTTVALRACPVIDTGSSRRAGEAFAATVQAMSWPDFMAETITIAEHALPRFRALAELGKPYDTAVLTELVAHEEALLEFARLELAGHPDRAAAVLDRHARSSTGASRSTKADHHKPPTDTPGGRP